MESKILATVFVTVFLAELGDKTQLATLLFAADREVSKWAVFAGASLALVATSALGVLAGGALANLISPRTLQLFAGAGFVGIGLWTVFKAL
jgi:putative Ca2+/H+ antiporter (TMEM165/GDT1 family)